MATELRYGTRPKAGGNRPLISGVTLVVILFPAIAEAQAHVGLTSSDAAGRVNPTTVVGLALLSTAVPLAIGSGLIYKEKAEVLGGVLLGWGWVVGPSPWSLIYGNTTAGIVGLSVRGGCALAALAVTSGGTWDEDDSNGTEIALLSFMILSATTAVLEIVGLPAAVRDYNARQLTITPILTPSGPAISVNLVL